jgi:hypothetical protein
MGETRDRLPPPQQESEEEKERQQLVLLNVASMLWPEHVHASDGSPEPSAYRLSHGPVAGEIFAATGFCLPVT